MSFTAKSELAKTLVSAAALSAGLFAASATADAQCAPGTFCAQVYIGPSAPPPPVYYVQPAPPQVYYVQPAPPPPPVVYVQQPQVVQVQPAPQPQPPVVQVQAAPVVQLAAPAPLRLPEPKVGIRMYAGGILSDNVDMGGAMIGLRYRVSDHVAVEGLIGGFGGTDYNDDERGEFTATFDGVFIINPQSEFQVYGLLGAGVSFASVSNYGTYESSIGYDSSFYGDSTDDVSSYLGGEVGLGVEWRVAYRLGLTADVRGFIRQRVSEHNQDEFTRERSDGTTEGTNTSAGALVTVGAVLYL